MITGTSSLRRTERRLARMEAHLTEVYIRADAEMRSKADKFFAQFEEKDGEKRKKVEAGKLSVKEYEKWRKNKILYSRRFSDFRKKTAHELSRINETALAYINGEVPPVFADNCNDFGKSIVLDVNTRFDAGLTFDLVDADTIRLLAAEHPELLPTLPEEKIINIPLDERWNRELMQAELLQGILQGESIPDIAARMRNVVHMNKVSAVRNARTMVTSAQNGGRIEGMRRAEKLGVLEEKEWMSFDDRRRRPAHGELDGKSVPVDDYFVNSIGKIRFPGDPHADPKNVQNCRCTLGVKIIGFRDPVTGKVRYV